VIGNELGGTTGALVAGIGGGVLGGLIGGEIGGRLDEADRERASQATLQALERSEVEAASAPQPTVGESLPVTPVPQRQPEPVVASSPVVAWDSDENEDVSGTAEVVDAEIDTANRECRTVREIAYIGGEEIAQESQYCRDPAGSGWTKVA
jgi:surface antigen